MNTTAKVIIGVLGAAVVALAIGLGVALATGGDHNASDDGFTSNSGGYYGMMGGTGGYDNMMGNSGGYYGMMGAADRGDWQSMQTYMRQVMGDDLFNQMQQQVKDGTCPSTGNTHLDDFMHGWMYSQMYQALENGATPPAGHTCW